MEDMQKIVVKLQNRETEELTTQQIIDYCFLVIKNHNDTVEQCRAAVILSGIIQKGLGKKTQKFLQENPKLPARAHQVLQANIMRMECF